MSHTLTGGTVEPPFKELCRSTADSLCYKAGNNPKGVGVVNIQHLLVGLDKDAIKRKVAETKKKLVYLIGSNLILPSSEFKVTIEPHILTTGPVGTQIHQATLVIFNND